MSRSGKFLFACWACALIAVAFGYAYQWKLERDVRNAVAECEAQNVGIAAKAKAAGAEHDWKSDPYVCDPDILFQLNRGSHTAGIQGRITNLHTERARGEVKFFAYFAAMLLGLLGLVPYVWYFFLQRLREVAAAVRGD